MKTKLFPTILATVISLTSFAQDVVFKALASSGDATIERSSTPGVYDPIKMGTPVYKNDKIIMGANGYLGLTSTAGKTVQLKGEGIYPVNDLSGDLNADQSDIASKYIAYIFDGMKKESSSISSNMSLTGSVERSLGNAGINLFLPESTKIKSDKVSTINWIANEDATSYKIVLLNLFDEEVYSAETKGNSAEINFGALGLSADEIYKLSVKDNNNQKVHSGVVTLQILDGEELNKVNTDFAAIEAAAPGDDAISNLVKASFYEQNGMYMEAVEYFEKAIKAAPDVEQYKIVYENFKNKTGINGEL